MKKVVLNRCFGGFGISKQAAEIFLKQLEGIQISHGLNIDDSIILNELKKEIQGFFCGFQFNNFRSHPLLIKLIEEKGSKFVSGDCAKLKIIAMEDSQKYRINEYDGLETIEFPEDIDWKV